MTRTIDQMIASEVLCCMSSLVATLAGAYGNTNPGPLDQMVEQAFELAEQAHQVPRQRGHRGVEPVDAAGDALEPAVERAEGLLQHLGGVVEGVAQRLDGQVRVGGLLHAREGDRPDLPLAAPRRAARRRTRPDPQPARARATSARASSWMRTRCSRPRKLSA